MQTLKILAALLHYPEQEVQAAAPELRALVTADPLLRESDRRDLAAFLSRLQKGDLLELQSEYVATFDRGRKLSLHLFEHVHGESRDRGQAMVDLIEVYRHNGFELNARELPDYVPLFLEFLSQIPRPKAKDLLADAMPVLTMLGARLERRESSYAAIFGALEVLGGGSPDANSIRRKIAEEGADQTIVQMDKIWEEEAVTFLGSPQQGCGMGAASEQPVRWVTPSRRS